ncbi:nitrogen fixation-related uncharacterized protein [Arthrobacter sp. GAS37]|uniref:DUF6573 family protein n=1 Tax=Arthrobacter sp. GAS37 TaxID=3156261 RepID=UPI0038340E60
MESNEINPGAFDIIHVYLRGEAIADGVLRDVTEQAGREGYTSPVAVTAAAWHEAIAWDVENGQWQDESGRLVDVLVMAKRAIRTNRERVNRLGFIVCRVRNVTGAEEPEELSLVVSASSGDDGECVLTIMLDSED